MHLAAVAESLLPSECCALGGPPTSMAWPLSRGLPSQWEGGKQEQPWDTRDEAVAAGAGRLAQS